eukprot:CAMPEP_0182422336 /NCGR_PEP_ID=MMETSP1167-20130531/7988_1 /TAXON_ID=2988 /ORGANISM="Mallomonas Sp, Strain CCMP3275" /LENGTH=277 /DNA_ID=CAMNT_0024600303 /DNA_START=282 /DNA_END=1115 /DNA_ORIENTATION=+
MISESPTEPTKCMELSNSRVLVVFAASFLVFTIAELVGAVISSSLSLLGDAAAMSVDVFAYLCNLYAENLRSKYGHVSQNMSMLLEVGIPSLSVSLLLAVTTYITWGAAQILMAGNQEEENVDVLFLYGFSSANFVVDMVCTAVVLYRGKEIMYHSNDQHSLITRVNSSSSITEPSADPSELSAEDNKPKRNLNMISAITHVGGDTLRTSSMFIAALVSTITGVAGDIVDAWAAIIVTITIITIILPLCREIRSAYLRIRRDPTMKEESAHGSTETA